MKNKPFFTFPKINLEKPVERKALQRYQRLVKLAVRIGVVVLVIAFLWISLDGYHRLVSQKLIKKSAYLLVPLDPNINEEVLKKIESKKRYPLDQQIEAIFQPVMVEETTGSGEVKTATGGAERGE
ncbi:hypothetical protein J7J95_01685 [bacterium]|nr:hypothetical protein [bacterium]